MNRKGSGFLLGLYIVLISVLLVGCGRQNNELEWNLNDEIDTNAVSIDGFKQTDENPYGYNVGKIKDETVGEAVLITPGTKIKINRIMINKKNLFLLYQIHPQVSEHSDGAMLNVTVTSEEKTKQYTFDVGKKQANSNVDMSLYEGKIVDICISVSNKNNANEICDWVIIKEFRFTQEAEDIKIFGEKGYVRSATYFSDEWPLNFWNSEWDNLEAELKQIKNDGFDSVIIAIPWREFQPTVNPVAYNDYAFKKMNNFMQKAQEIDLDVYVRIGYTWDFYADEDDNIVDRFCRLMGDDQTRNAWNDYVKKLYDELDQYDCFCSAFLTWEDFWNNLGVCDVENENERVEKAAYIGYQAWVKNNYQLEEYNNTYNTQYDNYEDIAVPKRNEPAMYAMYEFYDSFLMNLLRDSQALFPDLSMEVRMDWDTVRQSDGTSGYYKHDKTFGCEDSSYTATMYGIPMGFDNHGERVTAKQALEKTDYILGQLKEKNNNKPVYVEQFIFADNTPKFKDNAQIMENDLNKYLFEVAEVLKKNSEGYGIWTYRNYCSNILYNPQFALKGEGWEMNDLIQIKYSNEFLSNVCIIYKNGVLKQNVPKVRLHFPSEEYNVRFDVKKILEEGSIRVSLGDSYQDIMVDEEGTVRLTIPVGDIYDLKIEARDGSFIIDNIKVYSQVQQGFLYDEDNQELQCIEAIRELNSDLK